MKKFYLLLLNVFSSTVVVSLVWFSLSLWAYTQTQSVLVNSIISGSFLIFTTATSIWFGSLVDHHKKKHMLILSSLVSLICFAIGFVIYSIYPAEIFTDIKSFQLWTLITVVFVGIIAGNIRGITLPTITTLMVEEQYRDKANGLSGTINGVSFLLASIISGFLLSVSGMYWIFIIALVTLILSIVHLFSLNIPEREVSHEDRQPTHLDLKETFVVVKSIPGLLSLIVFNSLNNFLGGVFMPLMDPYGLSLVSLQTWGVLWGFLSAGFIIGGILIAKFGLGSNPLRTMFAANLALWTICIFFTIQPWLILLSVGIFLYVCIVPVIEASEQTIIQKIVPKERQGRVFGFAQSIENAASPLTAFAIGPLTQLIFIPFMTTGKGVELIGHWFGEGPGRGIALVFTITGVIGLAITVMAISSKSYKLLSAVYTKTQS